MTVSRKVFDNFNCQRMKFIVIAIKILNGVFNGPSTFPVLDGIWILKLRKTIISLVLYSLKKMKGGGNTIDYNESFDYHCHKDIYSSGMVSHVLRANISQT